MRVRNAFIQAIGIAAVVYLIFLGLNWGIMGLLRMVSSFGQWYRYSFMYWAEEVALGLGIAYLVVVGVLSSRD